MKERSFTITDAKSLDEAMLEIELIFTMQNSITITVGKPSPGLRTVTQNASLHKYCSNISAKMNDAGFTQKELIGKFKEGFELPVTEHMIKSIFRAVGLAMYQKESTRKLSTTEIQTVHKVVDQRFGEVSGVTSPWPSREAQMMRECDE